MDERSNFLVLRYSLIEEQQRALGVRSLPSPKGRAVEVALIGDREYESKKVRYAFVGFTPVTPTAVYTFPFERYFAGKVAKLRKTQVGEKVPGDIIEHVEDDWIALITIFDFEQQFILVQRNWRFGTDSQIARAIEIGLRDPILAEYNHRVFVEARSRKEDFWKVIESHKKIYRLELNLISPNILDTNTKAREALDALKDLYGQESVSIKLENESGALDIPLEPVADYIDYISEGEGKWTVVTEGERGGKKTHKSESSALTVELPVPSEQEITTEGQLELETGEPAPGRDTNDARLIAEVHSETTSLERTEDDD